MKATPLKQAQTLHPMSLAAQKILVVDDDTMVLKAVTHSLQSEGYGVITASSGMEALGIIERERLNLIITDIMMPDLSGLNLISMLREFYSLKIPVIVISSLGKDNIIYPSLRLGATDFIIKPINFSKLLLRVKEILCP
jgi:DNA-binding response OmpR family regulator